MRLIRLVVILALSLALAPLAVGAPPVWVEGRNLTLDVRYPGDQYARLQELASELVKLKVDVLASLGTPATLAAKRATTTSSAPGSCRTLLGREGI
jgi:hypothetical protein